MRMFCRVGVPSSSTALVPRLPGRLPSSMTVMRSLATFCPTLPAYTERPRSLKSASRPWPTVSWISVPPASLETTTVYAPDGARGAAGERTQILEISDVSVGVYGALPDEHTDARALIGARGRLLETAVVEHERQHAMALPEDLRPVAATRQRRT